MSRTPTLLTLLSCVPLAACGGGSKSGPGLIVAGLHSPSDPGLISILRPTADGSWSREDLTLEDDAVAMRRGVAKADGRIVWRRVEDGQPVGDPVSFVADPDGWKLEPVAGLAVEDVEWTTKGANAAKAFQLKNGNVVHKAMWFEPEHSDPGILSISANAAMVKLWRKSGDGWKGETLWTGVIGDAEQRIRDVEVGDVDGDGHDEIVFVSHDRGRVYVLDERDDGKFDAQMISETDEPYWIHEVELGNVDGDAALEIFTTPSEPNQFDGEHQIGRIERFDFQGGSYVRSIVEDDPETHAKEILVTDFDGDGKCELFAAMEAKEIRANFTSDYPGHLVLYTFEGEGRPKRETVGDLVAPMCRFLVCGDTTGDGEPEIIAATKNEGILCFEKDGDTWSRRLVAGSYRSSGFEHAALLRDVDGDGVLDIVAAGDDQKKIQAFVYDPATPPRWMPNLILDCRDQDYMAWNLMPMPAGK
ncbi:MAG: VCBS repeat-containing protein [Planctomycetota bacterium]